MNEVNDIIKKLKVYEFSLIHLDLKNGTFYNGTIISLGADYMEFHDRKVGEVPIFFSEIKNVELYRGAL